MWGTAESLSTEGGISKSKLGGLTRLHLEDAAVGCTLTDNSQNETKMREWKIKTAARKHIPRGSAKFYSLFWI